MNPGRNLGFAALALFLALHSRSAAGVATSSQTAAILDQLQIIDGLLDHREQLAAGDVAAGVSPAVEGGVSPPGLGYGTHHELAGYSGAALSGDAKPRGRMPRSTSGKMPDATAASALTGQPVIEVGELAPCSGEIVLPMSLSMATLPGGMVRLSGQGTPNTWHAIQARDDLFSGGWAEIATVPADGAGAFTLDLAAGAPVTRYFRALVDSCPPCDPTVAKALVYVNGLYDWDTLAIKEPEQVCLTELGLYDTNGNYVTNNYGVWDYAGVIQQGYRPTGRYLETAPSNYGGAFYIIPYFVTTTNDFRINPWGDAQHPQASALLWGGEANLYYWVNEYRRNVVSPEFITELNLDAQTDQNLRHLQYRSDGITGDSAGDTLRLEKPIMRAKEFYTSNGLGNSIFPFSNQVSYGTRTRRDLGASLDPLSHAFDPEMVVGEYAGLIPFWLAKTNLAYPFDNYCEFWYRSTGTITPCINDGVNAWAGYTYTGNTEVYKTYSYNLRKWANRTCDTAMTPPCERGQNIDNVMMFEQGNTSGDQVFPFDIATPGSLTNDDGPVGNDVSGKFFAALFYDVDLEAGLGTHKANLLFFKTLSEVTNTQAMSMPQFGDLVLHAARLLWPDTNGLSVYERPIASVLTSRGIPLYGAPNILTATYPNSVETILPARIGDASSLSPYNEPEKFGSPHPDKQIAMSQNSFLYNTKRVALRTYTAPDSDYAYMTYNFYKHSKYGPCDKLMFSDGTFSTTSGVTFGQYNGDGTYLATLTGRSLGNKSLFIPGSLVRFDRFRMKCATEAEAAYFEDVSPFGWFMTQGMKNGFTFTTTRLAETVTNVTYQLDIFDPSLTLTGPRTGPATYAWEIADYLGNPPVLATNQTVQVTLPRNEPVRITVTRDRSGTLDVLTKEDRANDLDRESGRAFLMDCLNPDGSGNCW